MRDFQRQKFYDAENEVTDVLDLADKVDSRAYDFYGSHLTLPVERKFGDVESIQAYVNLVLSVVAPDAKPITVRRRRGDNWTKAHLEEREIAVPMESSWARREMVILHEITHFLTAGDRHGMKFACKFREIVGRVIGPEVALLLTAAYEGHDVKTTTATGLTSAA